MAETWDLRMNSRHLPPRAATRHLKRDYLGQHVVLSLPSNQLPCLPDLSTVSAELSFNLIPDPAEFVENLLLGALGMSGIIETPMETGHLTGIHWADLVGVTANGDDDIDPARQELIHVLGGMSRDIHAGLSHDLDRKGMHITRWLRARAEDLGRLADRGAQKPFGHMAATGITGTEDKDGGFETHRGEN